MLISLHWLRDFIKTPVSAQEIADRLSVSGLEVEHLETWESVKGGMQGFVIGQVMECEKHPNADKLSITKVDIGIGELQPIVCGAPNVAAGQKVVVATVGTQIQISGKEPFVIGEAKIRGEISRGMICAEDELGMGDSHDGILVLSGDATVGMKASEYFNICSDTVLDIGLTANRGDAASHLGVARDVAALFQTNVILPEMPVAPLKLAKFTVQVADAKQCSQYNGFVQSGIEILPSPLWMQNRLRAIEIEPKNIIVDATNYVLHELGQPIHAFDADKIVGNDIFVRLAKSGEKLTTLDKVARTLKGTELIIADASGPIALAGVMGGLDTAVSESTKNIFIESAHFDPTLVRKTARAHGLNTDASFRFERGTDSNMCRKALWRFLYLITSTTGGTLEGATSYYPGEKEGSELLLDVQALQSFAGAAIPEEKCSTILQSLGFEVAKNASNNLKVTVPTWRNDVTSVVDLYEEILRIFGYDNIPFSGKMHATLPVFEGVKNFNLQNKARQILTAQGFYEAMNNSLTSAKFYTEEKTADMVALSNPLSSDMQYMRATLLDGLLQNAAYNRNRKTDNIRFFEFGRVYHTVDSKFSESTKLALLVGGNQTEESWETKQMAMDYFYCKRMVDTMLAGIGFAGKLDSPISRVHNNDLKKHDLEGEFYYAELDWQSLVEGKKAEGFKVAEPPKFPLMRRDLSLVLDKKISYQDILQVIENQKIGILKKTGVVDVFEGKPLEDGKKAVGISFYLGAPNSTLTDLEADAAMNQLMQAFEKNTGAVIRR